MADLLFRAGIDDTPFKAGLKRLVKSGEEATKSLEKRGGVGGLLKEASAGFKAGLGFFGAQQAIHAIGQSWAFARQELEAYAKVNRASGVRQDESKAIRDLSNRNVGRLLDVSGARETWQNISSIPGHTAGMFLSDRDRNRLIGQEAESRRRDQSQRVRDFAGPMDEDVLRLQGRAYAAEILKVRRDLQSQLEKIRQDRDAKLIDGGTAYTLTTAARRNAQFATLAAQRVGTQGVGPDVPESLRRSFMGVADKPTPEDRYASVAALQDRFNKMNAADQYRQESIAESTNRTFIQRAFEFTAMWG